MIIDSNFLYENEKIMMLLKIEETENLNDTFIEISDDNMRISLKINPKNKNVLIVEIPKNFNFLFGNIILNHKKRRIVVNKFISFKEEYCSNIHYLNKWINENMIIIKEKYSEDKILRYICDMAMENSMSKDLILHKIDKNLLK